MEVAQEGRQRQVNLLAHLPLHLEFCQRNVASFMQLKTQLLNVAQLPPSYYGPFQMGAISFTVLPLPSLPTVPKLLQPSTPERQPCIEQGSMSLLISDCLGKTEPKSKIAAQHALLCKLGWDWRQSVQGWKPVYFCYGLLNKPHSFTLQGVINKQ